jgi:hypothetical protein
MNVEQLRHRFGFFIYFGINDETKTPPAALSFCAPGRQGGTVR